MPYCNCVCWLDKDFKAVWRNTSENALKRCVKPQQVSDCKRAIVGGTGTLDLPDAIL